MSPFLQEMLVTIRHREVLRALLAEKQAMTLRQQAQFTTRRRSPWAHTYGTWRLRWQVRHARLRKRHYSTSWLEDLHRIVEAHRRHER